MSISNCSALSLTQLDGRTLVIEASRVSKKTASSSKRQTKLIVRNLAFAASVGDVRDLFRTFGPLKNVRVPKRYDGRRWASRSSNTSGLLMLLPRGARSARRTCTGGTS